MIIGYARVSTVEQNLDAQLKALEEAGATKIYQDKKSGKDMHREGLQEMLSTLKAGTLWSLQRLIESLEQLKVALN